MLEIKIAGPGCKNCEELSSRVHKVLEEMRAEATLMKITDYQEIAASGVMMTPGLIVNGKVLSQGRLPSEGTIRDWLLEAKEGSYLSHLCGRQAVQINVRGEREISFRGLAERLGSIGEVKFNEHMLRFRVNSYELTVFPDGRTIVKGTTDEAAARTLYARYIGA